MGGTCVTDQRKETLLAAATRRVKSAPASLLMDGSEPDTGSLVVASHMDAI